MTRDAARLVLEAIAGFTRESAAAFLRAVIAVAAGQLAGLVSDRHARDVLGNVARALPAPEHDA